MHPKDEYLVLYNGVCCVGWLVVWMLAMKSILMNVVQLGFIDSLANVYNDSVDGPMISLMLSTTQLLALMEIVHAAIGFVRSPVAVTTMQVMSRIVALFAIYFSPNAQSKCHNCTCHDCHASVIDWAVLQLPSFGEPLFLEVISRG